MKKDYIYKAFDNQDVVMVSGKRSCVNPLLDYIPATEPGLQQKQQIRDDT